VFVFVGDPADAPAELTGWRFAGHATRGRLTLPLRGEDVGRKATVVGGDGADGVADHWNCCCVGLPGLGSRANIGVKRECHFALRFAE
jgi:hypothetical protein